jgi:hypothetical protein
MRMLLLILVLLSTVMLGGCELVGDIFQAGVAVGAMAVLVVIVGIVFLIRKLMG